MSVVLCDRCGLVQTRPRMSEEAYQDFYDRYYSSIYHPFRNTVEDYFREQYKRGQRILSWIESQTGIRIKKLRVLEIGCGAGGVLKAFSDQGAIVQGCDLISAYVDHARTRHQLDVIHGTLADLPDGPVPDLVIYSHVVEHLLHPFREFELLKQRLKSKETLLYIEVPGIRHIRENYNWDFLSYLQNAHVWHFTLESLTAMMSRAGFELVHGTQWVWSLFRLGDHPCHELDGERDATLAFLAATESHRWKRFLSPQTLKRETIRFVLKVLDWFGLRERLFKLQQTAAGSRNTT
ncbi:MAG: class I SAM-dependent methyltransferase [Calditrichaeota bacterium]|nr:class I SAM-dependent methyltransferase [Calditrichota bacterium]